jgi:hypothetical protein
LQEKKEAEEIQNLYIQFRSLLLCAFLMGVQNKKKSLVTQSRNIL